MEQIRWLIWLSSEKGPDFTLRLMSARPRKLPLDANAEQMVFSKIDSLLASTGKERVAEIRLEMEKVMTDLCSVFRDSAGLEQALSSICGLQGRSS